MHRRAGLRILIVFVAGPLVGSIVAACSSSSDVSGGGDAGDGGVGPNQPANHACDPTLASPCLAAPPCYTVKCDEYAMVCDETFTGCSGPSDGGFVFETGAADVTRSSGCQSSFDCLSVPAGDGSLAVTYVCVFSAYDGCQSKGVCVLPEPPRLPDGAAETACGCSGQPVPYVTDTQTAAPVASPAPCVAPVVDAGADVADSAGPPEGGEGGPDSAIDAAEDDAGVDAPIDG